MSLMALATLSTQVPAQRDLRVVTSLTTYAAIAREIAGDRAEVTAIADGAENPHFVQPKPSFVLLLRRADLLVTTGMDLELWMPALLDKANNLDVRTGGRGQVIAREGISLLNVPESVSRAQGDIHIFGNPHIWTDPVNGIIIAENIRDGLARVAPSEEDYFNQRFERFKAEILELYLGPELLELLGQDVVYDLGKKGELLSFLRGQSFQGRPLLDRAGGLLLEASAFRGREMVCYHKEWDYFSRAFGIPCVDYVEPKPGIPPTPKHVAEVISLMSEHEIPVLLSTNYYARSQVESVADRTDAQAVIVPSNTEGIPGVDTYQELISLWVSELAQAFNRAAAAGGSR